MKLEGLCCKLGLGKGHFTLVPSENQKIGAYRHLPALIGRGKRNEKTGKSGGNTEEKTRKKTEAKKPELLKRKTNTCIIAQEKQKKPKKVLPCAKVKIY